MAKIKVELDVPDGEYCLMEEYGRQKILPCDFRFMLECLIYKEGLAIISEIKTLSKKILKCPQCLNGKKELFYERN